jgi:hypothetical protein
MFLDEQYSELQGGSYPSGAIPHRLQTLPSCSILVRLQEWRNLHLHKFGGKISDEKVTFILDFKLSPCSKCCMFSSGWFPGFWILYADVSEHSVSSIYVGHHPPEPVLVLWPAPTLSPSFLMAQAIFGPKLFSCSLQHSPTQFILRRSTCLWRWKDRVFRNVGIQNSDAGELPRRKHKITERYSQASY